MNPNPTSRHPIQPTETDAHGTVRFKANAIVRYLLDNGPFDLNHLAGKLFPDEDREQFAQLIGYSLSGSADLSYVTNETYEAAVKMSERGSTEEQARIAYLEETLDAARSALKLVVPVLFNIHPDDLKE